MQQKNQCCFELYQSEILRIERFLKRGGWTIQIRFRRQPPWIYQCNKIADDNHQPKKAGEDSVKLEVFPNSIFALEIEIERLVIGAVAQVMSDVTLPPKLE